VFTLVDTAGIRLVKSELLLGLPVRHAITTRIGGVSKPPFDSLNMGLHVGDDNDSVCENRRRVCTALDVPLSHLVAGEQVHGCNCYQVMETDAGRGAQDRLSAIQETDILVTNTPGVLLASFYADCVPVILVDPIRLAVAVAHCGWRGTQQEVPRVAIESMTRNFGTRPSDLRVVIGPSIGPCCYEVSVPIATSFQQQFGPDVALGRQLDLRLANFRTLQNAGVSPDMIHIAPWCTSCQHELFFSHRASGGRTGRIAALVGVV
jgi:YfiH family protein